MGIVTLLGLFYMVIIFFIKMISNINTMNTNEITWFGNYDITKDNNNIIKSWDTYGFVFYSLYAKTIYVHNNIGNIHSQCKALKKPERRRIKKMIFYSKIFEIITYVSLVIFG